MGVELLLIDTKLNKFISTGISFTNKITFAAVHEGDNEEEEQLLQSQSDSKTETVKCYKKLNTNVTLNIMYVSQWLEQDMNPDSHSQSLEADEMYPMKDILMPIQAWFLQGKSCKGSSLSSPQHALFGRTRPAKRKTNAKF
ncbi:hypothetical protein F2Q69_00005306 [Brassica cretica]|uniref:Uncharacterized protein n=1 Tax=Brassica cretica TaxID=69181 RepID=A0A8S9P4I5_BRACR|nr:hypothetical protein F2Q69_00005306 [Brassica cretica]